MTRNFEDKIVLTSQYPEAFLTFNYDGSIIYIDPSTNEGNGLLFINGWDVSSLSTREFELKLNSTEDIASFLIHTNSNDNFDINLRFNIFSDVSLSNLAESIDVSILNRPHIFNNQDINSYETFTPIVDDEASYLLLQTNPKYSGNVKLVIDPSNNLYLDTFKVSEILSNKKYRKQSVSANSFFSGDIRRVFETLPLGEIYRLDDEDTLDISQPKTEYSDQFNNTYNYGANILVDELYNEEYSILAPLWINTKLPNYFSIFRLPGTYNNETYDVSVYLEDLAINFLKDSSLIKTWNLKDNNSVGNYLNNHLSELSKINAPLNLSLNEYDPNTWNGIAIDKGIITGRSEVPYFFEKITNNFTDINAFVSQGFERNNLLCPNLLNLEFIFNDHDVSLYSMNRYFGLYLEENELYKISYYSSSSDGAVSIINLDDNDSSIFIDSSIFNSSGDIINNYKNRIFVLNDNENLNRIHNISQIDGSSRVPIENYINKLGVQLFSTPVEKININTFISFKIKNILNQGEHLRIINKSQNEIWEVYGVLSDFYEAGESGTYASTYDNSINNYPIINRVPFSTKGTINNQIDAIKKAFDVFSEYDFTPFRTGIIKSNSLSILIKNEYDIGNEFVFQRLTGQTVINPDDASSNFNNIASYNDISFYNIITPDVSDFNRLEYDSSYGPINFELYGDRMSLTINMVDPSGYNVYSFDSSISELFTDNVLYSGIDNWNRLIQSFDISTALNYNSLFVENPISFNNDAIIITENEIHLTSDNLWNGYDVFPISISLMGINPVKNIDYTVYDSTTDDMNFKSDYWYKRENDASTYEWKMGIEEDKTIYQPNSFEIIDGHGWIIMDNSIGSVQYYTATDASIFYFNTFFNSATIHSITDTRITYNILDGSSNFTSYDSSISEEYIYDYYSDDYYMDASTNENYKTKKNLKYGLTIPTISKWGVKGKDCRNNYIRLNLSTDFFNTDSSYNTNFIPDASFYTDEMTFPVFKYLDSGTKNWEDYIYYDINDVVDDDGTKLTIKELMFEKPHVDVFSKIIYANRDIDKKNSRSSIFYYNIYKKEINTIIKGLKLALKISTSGQKQLNIQNWQKFRFSLIATPSKNKDNNYPIEVIINENTKTILMIWYQGNDVLNYSKRNSSYIGGKNNLINHGIDDENYYSFTTDASYSYTKMPFIINSAGITPSIVNMYDKLFDYDVSICTPLVQLNIDNVYNSDSIFNAFGTNSVSSSVFSFDKSYNTFNQSNVDYNYFYSSLVYGNNVSNYSFRYSNNYNYYKDKTCELDIFKYFIGLNNIQYYIIQEDNVLTNKNFDTPPIITTIYDSISYKHTDASTYIHTYNGDYQPIFQDILNFSSNEISDLTNIIKKDFIFSNTNLQSYNNLNQYWFNKVIQSVTSSSQDSSNNILYTSEFNPFKSSWDADYYVLSTDFNNSISYVDGFNSNLEKSSLFGSKLISLPNELILDQWDNNNSKIVDGSDYYLLEYNLSKTIINIFTNNLVFINNWNGLNISDDLINEYIIKTILNYYNISTDKISVNVYTKPIISEILAFTYDNEFKDLLSNISGKLYYENNEYIYKIKFNKTNNKSYFTKLTFNKK